MQRDLHLKEYQANSVGTADQKQLIVMLYEGVLRFLRDAEAQMTSYKTYDKANNSVLRAQDIFTELMVSLNLEAGGEIAQNLFNLYAYCKTQLLEANVQKKVEMIKPVQKIVGELLEAWKQMEAPTAPKAAPTKPTDYKGGFKAEG
ncbi:MAG: flagellar export chaperone FliS [Spirochaetes bacterium]|nr:flagellar export chaperone FliS [Spirochaetota bacterium]